MHGNAWTYPHVSPPFLDLHSLFHSNAEVEVMPSPMGPWWGGLSNSASVASEHHKFRASSLLLPLLPGEVAKQDWELTAWSLCSSETEWSAKRDKTTPTTAEREQLVFVQWAQILSSSLKVTGEREEGKKERKKEGRKGGREGGRSTATPTHKSLHSQIKPCFFIYIFLQ